LRSRPFAPAARAELVIAFTRMRPRRPPIRDDRLRGIGIVGSRPSGRSLSSNAIVARVSRFGGGAPLSLGDTRSVCSPGKRLLHA